MTHIVIERNDLPKILQNLPGVVEHRTENAIKAMRGAAQKSADEVDRPSTDTGAMREGMAIQTAAGDDSTEIKAAAKAAFVGNPSRFDPTGKMHTPERFEELCGEVEPLPTARNSFEIVMTLSVLMIYGRWWEEGDAWDFNTKSKRPASPWFTPSVLAWGASDLESHYEGMIEESLR